MRQELFKQAFIKGIYKRAEELGLNKEAFLGPVLAGVGRMFAAPILGSMATNKLTNLALNQKKFRGLSTAAKKYQDLMRDQGVKGMATNIASMAAGSAIVDPFLNPIFNKLEGAPAPEIPTHNSPQPYPGYY